jgi:hypothetical protein
LVNFMAIWSTYFMGHLVYIFYGYWVYLATLELS